MRALEDRGMTQAPNAHAGLLGRVRERALRAHVAVGQNQWYHFGVGAPPVLVYFSGDWHVHWGYGLVTHGHVGFVKHG